MAFKIFHSNRFDKELEKFDVEFKNWLSEKKDQQKVINSIKLLLELFNEEIKNLVKN